MMEWWIIGIVGIKNSRCFSSCHPIIPVFHDSNIRAKVKVEVETI
jgi:hypothetical protein